MENKSIDNNVNDINNNYNLPPSSHRMKLFKTNHSPVNKKSSPNSKKAFKESLESYRMKLDKKLPNNRNTHEEINEEDTPNKINITNWAAHEKTNKKATCGNNTNLNSDGKNSINRASNNTLANNNNEQYTLSTIPDSSILAHSILESRPIYNKTQNGEILVTVSLKRPNTVCLNKNTSREKKDTVVSNLNTKMQGMHQSNSKNSSHPKTVYKSGNYISRTYISPKQKLAINFDKNQNCERIKSKKSSTTYAGNYHNNQMLKDKEKLPINLLESNNHKNETNSGGLLSNYCNSMVYDTKSIDINEDKADSSFSNSKIKNSHKIVSIAD